MEYLLKSAGIIALFWLFYKVFLQRETFYNANRFYFLAGIFAALLLPFYVIYSYMEIPATPLTGIAETGVINMANTTVIPEEKYPAFDWVQLLVYIYIAGVLFLFIKFLLELISLIKFLKKSKKIRKENYYLLITPEKTWPFSFFNRIVVPESLLNTDDFNQILAHEKAHVKYGHSIDMLIVRILTILQWFNPFAWWYKYAMEQNLEFIADDFAQKEIRNLREYQYLLLKTGAGKSLFALTNNYFNTNLKKRIIMLQKEKSGKINRFKYILLLPLLSVFIYSFNTKEVYEIKPQPSVLSIDFIVPVLSKDIKEINGYGMRINPFTKVREIHHGIDYSCDKAVDVFAAETGRVIAVGENKKDGKYIKIKHDKHYQTNYFHLNSIKVKKNSLVRQGEVIGTVGNTGMSSASHLHFEIIKDGKYLNPHKLIRTKKQKKSKSYVYFFDKNSTDDQLREIAGKLKKESGVKVKIEAERNKKGAIISYIFSAQYSEDKEPVKYFQKKKDGIDTTTLVFFKGKFKIWTEDELIVVDKKGITVNIIEKKKEKSPDNKIINCKHNGPQPLFVINGKKYLPDDTKENQNFLKSIPPKSIGFIHVYKGDKAIERFGDDAKFGAILIITKEDYLQEPADRTIGGDVVYNGTRYYYAIWTNNKNKSISIYNRFGNKVNRNLAGKIYRELLKNGTIQPEVKLVK